MSVHRARRPRPGMGHQQVLAAVLLAAIVLTALPWPQPALAADEHAPEPGARSAIVVDAATGAVLFEKNSREEYAPASLTKMVTALVAVERAPLDKIVRVTHPIDVTPVLIGLEPGDELRLEDVVSGLLIQSGNDAALAIAETVGDGSTEKFVGWMNETAVRLGLKNTHFKNPHGLDQAGHVSSAYDMAVIGRAVMRNPVLARIVGESRHEVTGPPRWVFNTRNPLLGRYQGVDGIKTGFDDLAGLCLAATAVRDDRRAIAVVMNSPRYGEDAASLLDYAFDDQRWGPNGADKPTRRIAAGQVAMLRADLSSAGDSAPPTLARAGRLLRSVEQGGRP